MKKIKCLFLIVGIIICCTGCNPKTGTMTCTMSSYPTEGITLRSKYKAKYTNNVVNTLTTIEQVESSDEDNLETYKEKIEEVYQEYKDLDYYKNNISIKDNVLTSKTTINYDKVDTKKLIEIENGNSNVIKNGKVNIDDLKELYERNGCNCKKRK